ncbi:L-glyceraldehyde 3-phosphate reductase [Parabacteroides sp. GYB001]|uniref:L-glyceraldehyde 3-phosphate reductase n=1 Tax=Parabacteroides leei TaxID=2939491 RepID=UPI002017CEA2|nr:L-glyceraldehyde 3-phosphate reductase [Parabacteroides leei]MCL3850332.1 L-glyceraldehyde 3-phosphate reductase [Parabacteroides leei]
MESIYKANEDRYNGMMYRRCGRSGILLPAISLGLWHNFGSVDVFSNFIRIAHTAFDNGITHFDLANNYGPVYGSAEENFGRILKKGLGVYRDELLISTKAGYDMWPGPYGNWGSRKYLMASLDQSLKRMGLDYVDIFYSHRPDPETPLEETMGALADIVRQGKALYVGISNYNAEQTAKALAILKEHRVPCLIHQARYSLFDRWTEPDLFPLLKEEGVGMIAFSPLAQGLLTNKYLHGIPENSRAAKSTGHLQREQVTEEKINKIRRLNELAMERGQTLAEMALAWLLKDDRVTSVLVGASSVDQLLDNLKALENISFTAEEQERIERI